MSYTSSIDTPDDLNTYRDEDSNQREDGFQTTAASPDALSDLQQSTTLISNRDVHHQYTTDNNSTSPSPSSDRSCRHPLPAERQEVVVPVESIPNGSNELSGGPSSSAGHASNDLQRLAGALHQPVPPPLSVLSEVSTPRVGSSRAVSPAGWLKRECEELRKRQEELQITNDGPSRTPVRADFPRSLSMTIIPPVKAAKNCIILLHSLANSEASLGSHAQDLHSKQSESAFILLRGLQPIEAGNSGYHWADANGAMDEGFISTSRVILEDIIQNGLLAKCSFHPRDIVVLGHGQGGMAAFAAMASWNCVEFGGVVSFGGPMPGYAQLPLNVKAKTPALIYGGTHGDITPAALQQIQENFSFIDHYVPPSGHDTIPETDKEMAPLLEFFAHRLGREEWKQQAVISLGKNLRCL